MKMSIVHVIHAFAAFHLHPLCATASRSHVPHHGMSWWPHLLDAPLVAIILTWTALRALTQYSKIPAVRRPAMLVIWLLIAQLCLGFVAFITRVAWGHDAVQP